MTQLCTQLEIQEPQNKRHSLSRHFVLLQAPIHHSMSLTSIKRAVCTDRHCNTSDLSGYPEPHLSDCLFAISYRSTIQPGCSSIFCATQALASIKRAVCTDQHCNTSDLSGYPGPHLSDCLFAMSYRNTIQPGYSSTFGATLALASIKRAVCTDRHCNTSDLSG